MAERPTYVDVGPHRYRVRFDEAHMDRERTKANESGLDGQVTYSTATITIDPDGAPSYQREVLLHELLHAVLSLTGGNHFPPKASVDDVLTRIDGALLDTMQRNPHVVAWLVERE